MECTYFILCKYDIGMGKKITLTHKILEDIVIIYRGGHRVFHKRQSDYLNIHNASTLPYHTFTMHITSSYNQHIHYDLSIYVLHLRKAFCNVSQDLYLSVISLDSFCRYLLGLHLFCCSKCCKMLLLSYFLIS